MHNYRNLILPTLLSLTSTALAQNFQVTTTVTARTGEFAVDIGNPSYGTNVAMAGRAESRVTRVGGVPISSRYRCDKSVIGRVRVAGVNREAAAVLAFGEVGAGLVSFGATANYAAGYTMRVGGNTIANPSVSGTANFVAAWNSAPATINIFSTSVIVPTPIGLDVTLSLTARARASIAASATLVPEQLRVTLNGTARGVATGIASASVGVLCATTGVSATLNLLDTTISPTFTVGANIAPSGSFGYRVEPVRFLIDLFATLCGLTATVNVVNISSGTISGNRQLL